MNNKLKQADAATAKTTAKVFLPNEMFAIAYGNFADIYNEKVLFEKSKSYNGRATCKL